MSKKLKDFISSILDESLGFCFGMPWRYDENAITCVVPIIRRSEEKRDYLTLAEATNVQIRDTGQINRLSVFNPQDTPVFIRMGELLEGRTQNRTVIMSRIIMGKQRAEIEVACIHASRSIREGSSFKPSGYSPLKDGHYAQALDQKERMLSMLQCESWEIDRGYHRSSLESLKQLVDEGICVAVRRTDRDDLARTRDEYNKAVKEILKGVPSLDYQVGIALVDVFGFYSLDCYDAPESWDAVKEAVIEKESLAIMRRMKSQERKMYEFKMGDAVIAMKEALRGEYRERVHHQEERTETVTLGFDNHAGEAVYLDDKIIHLLVTRKLGGKKVAGEGLSEKDDISAALF